MKRLTCDDETRVEGRSAVRGRGGGGQAQPPVQQPPLDAGWTVATSS